jgi:hypothetical protein
MGEKYGGEARTATRLEDALRAPEGEASDHLPDGLTGLNGPEVVVVVVDSVVGLTELGGAGLGTSGVAEAEEARGGVAGGEMTPADGG